MYVQDSFGLNMCRLQNSISMKLGEPVLLSVNVTFNGVYPDVGDAEKAAFGGADSFQEELLYS